MDVQGAQGMHVLSLSEHGVKHVQSTASPRSGNSCRRRQALDVGRQGSCAQLAKFSLHHGACQETCTLYTKVSKTCTGALKTKLHPKASASVLLTCTHVGWRHFFQAACAALLQVIVLKRQSGLFRPNGRFSFGNGCWSYGAGAFQGAQSQSVAAGLPAGGQLLGEGQVQWAAGADRVEPGTDASRGVTPYMAQARGR